MQSILTRRIMPLLTSSVLTSSVLTSSVLFFASQACAQVQNAASTPPVARGTGRSGGSESTGRIGRAALQLRDFEHDGMRLELGEIEFNNLSYRTWDNGSRNGRTEQAQNLPMQVTGAGLSKVHLIVNAASLQKLMQGRIKDVSDLRLSLQNDRVKITGTRPAPFIGVPLPFSLDARLEARQGDQLWLGDARLSLGGAPVPEGVTNGILGNMNPIYVVNFTQQWGFRTVIKTIVARNDKLDINGNLVFMTTPATSAPATSAPAAGATAAGVPATNTQAPAETRTGKTNP